MKMMRPPRFAFFFLHSVTHGDGSGSHPAMLLARAAVHDSRSQVPQLLSHMTPEEVT